MEGFPGRGFGTATGPRDGPGVLTNGSQEQQISKLRSIGLYDLVDVVCTAEDLGLWKPDPRAFHEFARRLGVASSECLFIGDHPDQDIAGATAAGMPAAIIDHYTEDPTDLEVLLDSHIQHAALPG